MFALDTSTPVPARKPLEHGGRPRITRMDVFDYVVRHPGARAGEIAAGLRAGQPEVSAHLQRGKGRAFATQEGRWYPIPAADPRAGPGR